MNQQLSRSPNTNNREGRGLAFGADRPCVSFCGTADGLGSGRGERLRTPDDLARWLVGAGLVDWPCQVTEVMLSRSLELRGTIQRLCRAASTGDVLLEDVITEGDRRLLNSHARHPRLRWQVTEDWRRKLQSGPEPVEAALATIAADAIDMLTDMMAGTVADGSPCASPSMIGSCGFPEDAVVLSSR